MKKCAFFICAGLMAVLLIFVSAYCQEDMVVVNDDAFDNPQRPPSVFRHEEHNEKAGIEECNECHHIYVDGVRSEYESSEDQYCSDCHQVKKSVDGKYHLRKAFHINCKGCHLEKKAGPVMCGECHVKEGNE